VILPTQCTYKAFYSLVQSFNLLVLRSNGFALYALGLCAAYRTESFLCKTEVRDKINRVDAENRQVHAKMSLVRAKTVQVHAKTPDVHANQPSVHL
jgi:hypothetical protein